VPSGTATTAAALIGPTSRQRVQRRPEELRRGRDVEQDRHRDGVARRHHEGEAGRHHERRAEARETAHQPGGERHRRFDRERPGQPVEQRMFSSCS
jgi:hypothetical protein